MKSKLYRCKLIREPEFFLREDSPTTNSIKLSQKIAMAIEYYNYFVKIGYPLETISGILQSKFSVYSLKTYLDPGIDL